MSFRPFILLLIGMVTGLFRTLAAAEPTPYHGTPHLTSTRIEAEHFDHGGQGVAYRGSGAVVTNPPIRNSTGGLFTLIYPPIPRERPDADIGVVTRSGDTNRYLALREGEWAVYTFTVPAEGYYSVLMKTRGPEPYGLGLGSCNAGGNLVSQSRLRVSVDEANLVELTYVPTNAVQARMWLTAGTHRLKLTATRVLNLPFQHAWLCDYASWVAGGWEYSLPSEAWQHYTLPLDWLRIEPSPAPLRADLLAGGTEGFADGTGSAAKFSWAEIAGEVPTGELVIYDSSNAAFRLVSRSGQVRTWAGYRGNPPKEGHGTNAGFGPVRHTLVKPDGTLLVLHRENFTNDLISAIAPGGDVMILFRGRAVVPAAQRDILPLTPSDDLPVALDQLLLAGDGSIEAEARYGESFSFFNGMSSHHVTYQKVAKFRVTTTGEATLLSASNDSGVRPNFQDLEDGYRLERSVINFVGEDQFSQHVYSPASSAYRAADGSLWGSAYHQVFQLTPDPSIRYLTVQPSPDGQVDGPTELAVSEAVEQYLRAVPSKQFRVFSHWSDGNTENPRLLRLDRDTSLTPHFVIRLPEAHGIHPASLIHEITGQPTDLVRFSLIGPEPEAAPYKYQVEYSDDLVTWRSPANSAKVLGNSGSITSGYVNARQPTTTLEVSTFYQTTRRYYRARLVVE